jgi:hypothetical protein
MPSETRSSAAAEKLLIARRESGGRLVLAVFLVDAHCLGAKDAFWKAGTQRDFDELFKG